MNILDLLQLNKWQCKSAVSQSLSYFPFDCHLQFTNDTIAFDTTAVLGVRPAFHDNIGNNSGLSIVCFNKNTFFEGSYTCDIFPGSEVGPNISTIQTNVTVWATVDGVDLDLQPIEIPFIPAVYVENEISISEDTHTAVLLIHGIPKVLKQVSVSDVFVFLNFLIS